MTKNHLAKHAARQRQRVSGGPYSAARRSTSWPPDMVLTIDTPDHVTQLLYVRSAWGLHTAATPPRLDPEPDTGRSAAPRTTSMEEWALRWDAQWALAWQWYEIEQTRAGLDRPTPEQFRALVGDGAHLNPYVPPVWLARYGDEGFDHDAYRAWVRRFIRFPLGVEAEPARQSVRAVTAAWRTGLEAVIVLPYTGDHAERITVRHLVVSDDVWQTTALRDRALALPVTKRAGGPATKGGS